MCEDLMKLGNSPARVPTHERLKIAERVAVCKSGDMDKVSCIDERKEESQGGKLIITMSASIVQVSLNYFVQNVTGPPAA